MCRTGIMMTNYFNPLPRKEGDCNLSTFCGKDCYFNPLPRKEGDAWNRRSETEESKYFNPLPRKEGDRMVDTRCNSYLIISIHSLVKRETV